MAPIFAHPILVFKKNKKQNPYRVPNFLMATPPYEVQKLKKERTPHKKSLMAFLAFSPLKK